MLLRSRWTFPAGIALLAAACGEGTDPQDGRFLDGAAADRGIAISISGSQNSLLMLQTGAPTVRQELPLGASSAVTAVGYHVRGTRALIPLGNAASVAVVNLDGIRVERFFTFPSGNATGSAWFDDQTGFVCNLNDHYCGRFTRSQTSGSITDTVHVAPKPTGIVVHEGRVFIISSNLDETWTPIGDGIVTEIDPEAMSIIRTFTVGTNPQFGAIGPDGNLYVTNSGNYGANDGSLSILDLDLNSVETVTGFGDGPGALSIDEDGRVFVSSFSVGTVVWDLTTREFLRDPTDPVCAPLSGGGCRGASSAAIAPNGDLYQAFYGSASSGRPAYLFIYDGSSFALEDSIPVPLGPSALTVQQFD